jgi:hypothetical protein
LRGKHTAVTTSIRLDAHLADAAKKARGVESRPKPSVWRSARIVALKSFKAQMKKNSGKLKFSGLDQ